MEKSHHYSKKTDAYFSGVRRSFIEDLPDNPSGRLLEIGCGDGSTSAYALSTRKCGWCCGVELCSGPAEIAKTRLSEVIVGDIDQLELPIAEQSLDVLILSEVLEHLPDPQKLLRRLKPLMKPGGFFRAGSPNVAYYRTITMLLRGEWNYTDVGIMDATHLRWFTPKTYAELFRSSGFVVDFIGSARPLESRAKFVDAITFGRFNYLWHPQIVIKGHLE